MPASVDTLIAARDAAFASFTQGFRLVDLSAALGPDSVIWPGAPALSFTDAVSHEGGGYHARVVTTFEHAGTHFDAPEHFVPGGADTAGIGIDELVVPAVVIDIRDKAAADPNAVVEVDDLEAFEAAHGPIRPGTAVLIDSGWAARSTDALAYTGSETTEDLRFPGFGLDAARALVEKGVVGLGVDTLGIDPGDRPDFPVHREVTHPAGLWHLENLVNVDRLPASGAVIAVGVPRIVGGTGFPTRVFAFVPKDSGSVSRD
ncbi:MULTISPECIES: cyclase family protein [Brevibacterium]|uniref:Cyclase family protein n=1 Tax=Brevibacterium salitolerans TaxID=1403566 RepID=A0ABP5IBC5_9MICO|nr:cyclase family protein [Brevibacterium sp.]